MPGFKPEKITLTERQYELLQHILRREKSSQQQIRPAKVILASAEPSSNRDIAKRLHLTLQTVRRWRRRWLQLNQAMCTAEQNGDEKQLRQLLLDALSDQRRSGRPAEFTPEQICQIVAMGCEQSEGSDRPISHWTAREIADEAVKRGIVPQISPRSAARFFRRGRH
jgi:putative transposase